jgi:glutaredoxin 3
VSARIEIYTREACGYCDRARALFGRKGVQVTEYKAGADRALRAEMIQRAGGGSTFPQIFIDGRHVGGSDDVHALEARGELDALLFPDGR